MKTSFVGIAVALSSLAGAQRFPALDHRRAVNAMVEDRADAYWTKARTEPPLQSLKSFLPVARAIVSHGDFDSKKIALTFDDGPHPGMTEKLLATLRRENVPATFFVVGKMAERSPNLIRDEAASGNLVEDHTFSHVELTKVAEADVRTEFRACSDVVEGVIGVRPAYCRPPGGDVDSRVVRAAEAEGLKTVLWTDDPGDYSKPGASVVTDRLIAKLHPGAIVLLHDGVQDTIDALPRFIAYARAHGYKFVTIDQLA